MTEVGIRPADHNPAREKISGGLQADKIIFSTVIFLRLVTIQWYSVMLRRKLITFWVWLLKPDSQVTSRIPFCVEKWGENPRKIFCGHAILSVTETHWQPPSLLLLWYSTVCWIVWIKSSNNVVHPCLITYSLFKQSNYKNNVVLFAWTLWNTGFLRILKGFQASR